jgi:kynureninase
MGIMSLEPSLRLCARIGMDALRSKSLLLTGFLEFLIDTFVGAENVEVVTPRDPDRRGCQLSIRIRPARLAVTQSQSASYENGTNLNNDADLAQRLLLERHVMCDNRPPDILRLAPVPTYNSFGDVLELVRVLASLFKKSQN